MKQYKIVLTVLLGLILTSCYNKFEEPKAPIEYNDKIFSLLNPDLELISIADLKELFGETSGMGDTEDKNKTKYVRFVADEKECTAFELENGWYNLGNYYIKGKVISNDEEGNIYKSLYIFDGTGAIELKLTNGLYLDYPCNLDTKESVWVYVKVRGLYLGNNRMMLSLGDIPTTSYNSYGRYKYYPNSNIASPTKVKEHILLGEKCHLCEGERDSDDILVVDKNSYSKLHGEGGKKYLGRLIRFKDLTIRYAGVPYPDANGNPITPPSVGDNVYPQWFCSAGIPDDLEDTSTREYVVYKPWYKMAYSINGISQYGSVLATYSNDVPSSMNKAGVYTIRTSGYSRFAGKYQPKNGTRGDVLAIYSLYSETWNSTYANYQLSVCRYKDFDFATAPHTEHSEWSKHLSWAEANFPHYSLNPMTNDEVHAQQVALWKKAYIENKPIDNNQALWDKWNEWGDWVVWCLENTPKESWLLPQFLTEEEDAPELN